MKEISIIAVTAALIGLKITDIEVKTRCFDVGIGRRIVGFRVTKVEFELPSLIILIFDLKNSGVQTCNYWLPCRIDPPCYRG